MDNSLLDVGAQCSLPSCNNHDFLPIRCPACSNIFCNAHILSDLHQCPLPPATDQHHHDKLQRCAFLNCNKLSLDAYNPSAATACPSCEMSYCADHRHSNSHNCVSSTTPTVPKNDAARALLSKIASASSNKPKPSNKITKQPTDPVKLAAHRKVEVMKMRHRAIPLDPRDKNTAPPVDKRLHIKIVHDDRERAFWTRKDVITGKVLDLLCDQLKIKSSDSSPLQLFKQGHPDSLQNNKFVSEQVEDGSTLSISHAP